DGQEPHQPHLRQARRAHPGRGHRPVARGGAAGGRPFLMAGQAQADWAPWAHWEGTAGPPPKEAVSVGSVVQRQPVTEEELTMQDFMIRAYLPLRATAERVSRDERG